MNFILSYILNTKNIIINKKATETKKSLFIRAIKKRNNNNAQVLYR